MAVEVNPLAGKAIPPAMLVNVPRLVTAYFSNKPDPKIPSQRVAFGTSGHRGSAFNNAFNEAHILAISQALCDNRRRSGIDGPLFMGIDTHALAESAFASALEVFAANDVTVMIDERDGYTPTPAISHAILTYNKNRTTGLADGVAITPSHNPPEDGGFKYNPPNGGPADTDITAGIERAANAFLEDGLRGLQRISYHRAHKAACVHRHDYIGPYVADLANVIDMEAIRVSGVKIGIDPLGGAAVHFWQPIIERYGIAATIVSDTVDPTFRFMTADRDARQVRCRFRQRYRRRPAWHRHPLQRADESEPLSRRRDCLSVREPPGLGQEQRGGEDDRQQRDHRSRGRKTRPQAGRDPGGLQMVRRWPDWRVVRIRRRGKRRCLIRPARWLGVDHRQGRHHSRPARRRDHRADQTRPQSIVRSSHRRTG